MKRRMLYQIHGNKKMAHKLLIAEFVPVVFRTTYKSTSVPLSTWEWIVLLVLMLVWAMFLVSMIFYAGRKIK